MARLFIDGFEHGDGGLWVGSTIAVDAASPITGAYSLNGTGTSTMEKTFSAKTIFYIAMRLVDVNGTWTVKFYDGSDNYQGGVSFSGTQYWVMNDDNTAEGGLQNLPSGDSYHLQFKFENIDTNDKSVEIKIDNISLHTVLFTNVTPNSATSVKVVIGPSVSGYMDDIVIDDADWPGAPYIYGLTPNADGATNEWTPSTGADNYALVDEVPANATDYNSSTVSGEVDLYAFSNLPDTDVWSVNSVQVSAYAKTPGPPEDEYLQIGARSAGVDFFDAPHQLSTSFAQHSSIFETSPATGSAWTQDEVNSCEFGVKEVSGA